jgi:hypothetical protein
MKSQSVPTQASLVNLQTRIVNILTKPKQEWPVIAVEPKDIPGLYRNYIVLLAAIPAVCTLIGTSVVGFPIPFDGTYRVGFGTAFASAVVQYVLSLVGVYVAGLVIAKLAPNFQSEPDTAQAVKLVAYGWTPAWIAGVLMLYPALSPLVMLASLYGIYLIYLGVSPLMKTPAEKVVTYLVVSVIVLIVVYFVIALIVGAVFPVPMVPSRSF